MRVMLGKEIAGHLMSLQFTVLLCVTIFLFSAAGLLSSHSSSKELSTFNRRIASAQSKPSTVSILIYRKPSPLQFMAWGEYGGLPFGYQLRPSGHLTPLTVDFSNKKMPEAPVIDWTLIIKLVFSLYAILLGYDAVSREKEEGTLALVFSYSVSRTLFLANKYISILLTLLIPLIGGSLICISIIGIRERTIFILPNISRIFIMCVLSAILVSIFTMLSLWISSLVKQSSVALFLLLACWILLTIIIPNSSGLISEHFIRTPSEYQITRSIFNSIELPYSKRIGDKISKLEKERGGIRSEEQVRAIVDPIFTEGYQKRNEMAREYYYKINQQSSLARKIVRVSPIGLFQLSAESLAMTGEYRLMHFQNEVMRYSNIYDDYVRMKVGKLVPWTGNTISWAYELNNKYSLLVAPEPQEYKGNMSDFPWFIDKPPLLLDGLKSSLRDLLGLIIWNIVVALVAFGTFLRADVR